MNKLFIVLTATALFGCSHAQTPANSAPPSPTAPVSQPAASTPPKASESKAKPEKSSKASAEASSAKLSCAQGKDNRTLEVTKTEKGCALEYTKAGTMSKVATSANGTKHCDDAQNKIRAKLEGAGFKCQ
jgi:hypothetical protein